MALGHNSVRWPFTAVLAVRYNHKVRLAFASAGAGGVKGGGQQKEKAKMTVANSAAKNARFRLPYYSCRNISSPEDSTAGRRVYAGHVPASSVLDLEDDENVRQYLVDAPGKERRAPTLVHQAIRRTLEDNPDVFSILNGGMVIVARGAEVDDKGKFMLLDRPSIINGSQTQGELRRHHEKYKGSPDFAEPSLKYELIVTNDDDLIAEISIARNFQNDVRAISIAGRRGQLDELEEAVQRALPNAKLRKSETHIVSEDGYLDTEKLIQVIFALMPPTLLSKFDLESKVFTYSQKTRCLKMFQRIVSDPDLKPFYQYFLDIAGEAWETYEVWKAHQGFKGTRLRSIERDNGDVVEVPDGIIFPIIASLSAFVKQTRKGWKLIIPDQFEARELIEAAAQAYMEIADHNPQTMGKNKACYSTLLRLTTLYARFS